MNAITRAFGALVFVAACGALGYGAAALAASHHGAKVIKVTARRFSFVPDKITLKKGEAVTLEFHTEDVLMGFNAPDFSTRTDFPPGAVTRVALRPDKAGTFAFLCDVFCGSGHETMNGVITVVE